MSKKTILLLISSILIYTSTLSQFSFLQKKTKVRKTPVNAHYVLTDDSLNLQNGFLPDKELWIVYSDRNNNTTYTKPGGELHLKQLTFLDAAYVIGSSGDHLELAKYDPGLIKDPRSRKIDRKSVQYLGWIKQSNLLLWRTAIKHEQTKHYAHALTLFRNEQAFSAMSKYMMEDSLLMFAHPSLTDTIGKTTFASIFYIYKQSLDGKQYLIGRTPQITNDNIQSSLLGWVSKELVPPWGYRSYMTNANDGAIYFADKHTSIDSCIYAFSERVRSANIAENIFPVNTISRDTQRSIIATGFVTDVLDRSENAVINVLGNKIYYNEFKKIKQDQSRLNIVFVIDGGHENGKYLKSLQTVIQNLELNFSTTAKQFSSIRYGAVVYKDNLKDSLCNANSTMPLTTNYRKLLQYFSEKQKNITSCNDAQLQQAVFSGLSEAGLLLKPYRDESNIIVLIGAAGNNMNDKNWTDVISWISYAKARLLIFQTHSIPDPSYNDFVIQGKELILKSAANIAEYKKDKLVNLEAVLPQEQFSLNKGDSGIYKLDYPANAMMQGAIMFPPKDQALIPSLLGKGLDSMLQAIQQDNRTITQSLHKYFRTIATNNTKVDTTYTNYYPSYNNHQYLPDTFMKAFTYEGNAFYLPANTNATDSFNTMQYGILLTPEEYTQVINTFAEMAIAKEYWQDSNMIIFRHLKQTLKAYCKKKHIKPVTKYKRTTLASMLQTMTGYISTDSAWNTVTLRMIKKTKTNKEQEEALRFIANSRDKAKWLQENINNKSIRFTNNGQLYYWLGKENLP